MNVVHSIDAYVLRTMLRRCNYKPRELNEALRILKTPTPCDNPVSICEQRFIDTNIADLTMVINVPRHVILGYSRAMKDRLIDLIEMSLEHKPFEIVCIHDSFAVHPNNCNQLRKIYANILGDLVESTLIDDLLNQLYQDTDKVEKMDNIKALAAEVRQSNYGIC